VETAANSGNALNLVPDTPGPTPSYWCTWAAQNYVYGQGQEDIDFSILEGSRGAQLARNSINEELLLGSQGWLRTFYPTIRSDLFVVLDDGWDVPLDIEKQRDWFGSVALAEERFPSFPGDPAARLALLNQVVRALGWRGIGLWISAQEARACRPIVDREAYWRERLRWSHAAGVGYWKVDWGAHSASPVFRRMLTDMARREAPGMVIEHIRGIGPLNTAEGRVPREYVERHAALLEFADVVRTYDVTAAFSVPATLDRVAGLLAAAPAGSGLGLLNCEDEPLIGAALGCAIGVMRHPLSGLRPLSDPDLFFNGPRNAKRCLDEVSRAVRWQRLAPAFSVGSGGVEVDTITLWDEWVFNRGETWATDLVGRRIRQGAPARVARGLALPLVVSEGEPPYVLAARYPNGAVAVAALGRTSPEKGFYIPLADVTVGIGRAYCPVGVFGRFRSLTLEYSRPVERARVWAQDLLAGRSMEITAEVRLFGNRLYLPGQVIDRVGLSAATPGDQSYPGLVLVLG
jgi:hypothetical protein